MTIREADAGDRVALGRLAQLDSATVPAGGLLVGEVDGELRAAVQIAGRDAIADPFHRTSELVDLLRARARQIARAPAPRRGARRASSSPGLPARLAA